MSWGRAPDRGSAAVEFALVLPLLLLALLALLQVGLLARDSLVVTHAAREGAREAAVTTSDAAVHDAIRARASLAADRTSIEVKRNEAGGEAVTVNVAYRAPVVMPLVGWLFPDGVELSAAATMRQETSEGPGASKETSEGPGVSQHPA